MIADEKWKPLEEKPLYEVSSYGRIRNRRTGKIKAQRKSHNGYMITDIKNKGQKHTRYVHRLVATTFIPNPCNYPVINHINEDKTDNRVENLEWCTIAYNNQYGTHIEKIQKTKEVLHRKKVKQIDVVSNKVIKVFPSIKKASKSVGVTAQAICWGLQKSTHTAAGFRWEVVV